MRPILLKTALLITCLSVLPLASYAMEPTSSEKSTSDAPNSYFRQDMAPVVKTEKDGKKNYAADTGNGTFMYTLKNGTPAVVRIPEYKSSMWLDEKFIARGQELRQKMLDLIQTPGFQAPVSELFDGQVPPLSQARAGEIEFIDPFIQNVIADYRGKTEGKKIAFHNFANAKQLGGGVLNGRTAQEESLSAALPSLVLSYLALPGQRGGSVFLPPESVMVTSGLSEDPDFVVLAAALPALSATQPTNGVYKLASMDAGVYPSMELTVNQYNNLILESVRNVVKAAVASGATTLITGAWGCGVYKHNPETIANAFKTVLAEVNPQDKISWQNHFDKVIFDIPPKGARDTFDNQGVFKQVLLGGHSSNES